MLSPKTQAADTFQNAARLHELLLAELPLGSGAVAWPRCSSEIPDNAPVFRMAYLDPGYARMDEAKLLGSLDTMHRLRAQTRRQYRNGLGFAVADANAWAACERADANAEELRAHLRRAYRRVYLPARRDNATGATEFERIDITLSGDTSLHEGVMRELEAKFLHEVSPSEIEFLTSLGLEDCSGIVRTIFPLADLGEWFFRFIGFPRLRDVTPVRKAVLDGVGAGRFGIVQSKELLRLDTPFAELRSYLLGEEQIRALSEPLASGLYLVSLTSRGS